MQVPSFVLCWTLGLAPICAQEVSDTTRRRAFHNFEAGPVHPVRVSADGRLLFVVGAPNHRLFVYSLAQPARPYLLRTIPVGLEPVAVAQRTADEVWVVNWLSDSVSVVSLSRGAVIDTLEVGDEPADVVFAAGRAFVTSSGRDEVYVFDARTRAPLGVVPVFGKNPRALAVGADGKVWALVFRSGNRTTILPDVHAPDPPPPTNPLADAPAPVEGLIVRDYDPEWQDVLAARLVDHDLVAIDPATLEVVDRVTRVGTILYDVVADPASGALFVANTNARNLVRFEPELRGHAVDSRVTRVLPGDPAEVVAWDVNPGVDYDVLPNPTALEVALAEPTGLALDPLRPGRLWAAFQGTDRVALLSTTDGSILARVDVGVARGRDVDTRGTRGPRALAAHPSAPFLYVFERMSHSLGVLDTDRRRIVGRVALFDPTPEDVKTGRKFLYDAKLSGNGTMSCAACHVDSEWDGLAWDLGDPGGFMLLTPIGQPYPFDINETSYHPMKGPMVTQTLRGMTEPYHWRGDRPELESFRFTYSTLMGGSVLPEPDTALLVTFLDSLLPPPNPNLALDRSLPARLGRGSPELGRDAFHAPATMLYEAFSGNPRVPVSCATCHPLPSTTNELVITFHLTTVRPGSNFVLYANPFKNVALRTVYAKNNPANEQGWRKGGFGLGHDGNRMDVEGVLSHDEFAFWPREALDDIAAFLLTIDTGTAPMVGRQLHLDAEALLQPELLAKVTTLMERALAGDGDLIAKGIVHGHPRGFLYLAAMDRFVPDDPALSSLSWPELRETVSRGEAELVLCGVPPGGGHRMGIDRDQDRLPDGVDGGRAYGVALPGCRPSLQLTTNDQARIGRGLGLVVAARGASAPGVVLLSGSPADATVGGLPLLVDVQDEALTPLELHPVANGFALAHVRVPADPGLVGRNLYAQAFLRDACHPSGWSASNGLALVVAP